MDVATLGAALAIVKNQSNKPTDDKETKHIEGKDVPMNSSKGYINGSTGEFAGSSAGDATDYIPLPGTTNYVSGCAFLYNDYGVAFYDVGKRYISGITGTSTGSSKLTAQAFSGKAPDNAKYFRFSLNNSYGHLPDDFAVTIRSEFSKNGSTISYAYTDVAVDSTNGYINATTGGLDESGVGRSSVFFKIPSVIGGTVSSKAYINGTYGVAFYDANRQFISGYKDSTASGYATSFTTDIPVNARYMRWSQVYTAASALQNFAVTFTVPYQHNIRDISGEIGIIDKYVLDATDGTVESTSGWASTDYIFVGNAKRFAIQASLYQKKGVAFYDAQKNIVSYICGNTFGHESSTKPVTIEMDVPNGVYYIRSTLYKNDGAYYTGPESFCVLLYNEDNEKNELFTYVNQNAGDNAHHVLILGDSYSSTRHWVNGLTSGLNVAEVINLGVTGATIKDQQSNRSTYPYTDRPTSSGTNNQNTLGSQVEKLKRLITGTDLDSGEVKIYADHTPDVVIIEGGMNDSADNSTKENAYGQQFIVKAESVYYKNAAGTVTQGDYYIKPDDETEVDRTSFAGAYRHIVEQILTLFPNAQVFIVTASRFNYFTTNPQGYDAIAAQQIKCARLCAATVIDWNGEGNINTITDCPTGSGTSEDPYTVYGGTLNTLDGLHPNTRGGRTYGRLAANVIKQRFAHIGEKG